MNKDEIFEVLAERQDCSIETLKNPKEGDHLSQYFNDAVNSSEDLDDLDAQLQYAIDILKRASGQLSMYTTLGYDRWKEGK